MQVILGNRAACGFPDLKLGLLTLGDHLCIPVVKLLPSQFSFVGESHILFGESAKAQVKDETASPLSPLEGGMSSLELGHREEKPSIIGGGGVCGGSAWLSHAAQSVPNILGGRASRL